MPSTSTKLLVTMLLDHWSAMYVHGRGIKIEWLVYLWNSAWGHVCGVVWCVELSVCVCERVQGCMATKMLVTDLLA